MTADVSKMSRDEIVAEINEIQPRLSKAFAEMGADYDASKITVLEGDSHSKGAQIAEMNTRTDALMGADGLGRFKAFDAAAATAQRAGDFLNAPRGSRILPTDGKSDAPSVAKSLGDMFVASRAFESKGIEDEIEFKADFLTSAGWAPEVRRQDRVVLSAERPVGVLDILPSIPTDQSAYDYMEETTFTNSAAETAEVGAYPEAALALTEQSVPVRKIAVFLPVSDEQLSDERRAAAYVNARLPFMLRQRADSQVLSGSGIAPNIEGFLNVTGINTQARSSGDVVFDALHKGMTKVRTTAYAEPEAVIMNPADWETLRLAQTTDGIYLLGSPADAGPKTVFGLPVVLSTAIPALTALVGAFGAHSALIMREGIELKVSDSHSDYFIKGKQAIRASMRVGLAVFRPSAFTDVDLTVVV